MLVISTYFFSSLMVQLGTVSALNCRNQLFFCNCLFWIYYHMLLLLLSIVILLPLFSTPWRFINLSFLLLLLFTYIITMTFLEMMIFLLKDPLIFKWNQITVLTSWCRSYLIYLSWCYNTTGSCCCLRTDYKLHICWIRLIFLESLSVLKE